MPLHHLHPSTRGALHTHSWPTVWPHARRVRLRRGDAFVWLGHLPYLDKPTMKALAALRPNGAAFVLYMTEPQSSAHDRCQLLTCPPSVVPLLSEVRP